MPAASQEDLLSVPQLRMAPASRVTVSAAAGAAFGWFGV